MTMTSKPWQLAKLTESEPSLNDLDDVTSFQSPPKTIKVRVIDNPPGQPFYPGEILTVDPNLTPDNRYTVRRRNGRFSTFSIDPQYVELFQESEDMDNVDEFYKPMLGPAYDQWKRYHDLGAMHPLLALRASTHDGFKWDTVYKAIQAYDPNADIVLSMIQISASPWERKIYLTESVDDDMDDMDDVKEFDAPSIRLGQAVKLVIPPGEDLSNKDKAQLQYYSRLRGGHLSEINDEYNQVKIQWNGLAHWFPRSWVVPQYSSFEYNPIHESEDLGGVEDFDQPPRAKQFMRKEASLFVKIHVPWDDPSLGYMGAWQYDDTVVNVSKTRNPNLYGILGKHNNSKSEPVPKSWCTPVSIRESVDDDNLGEMDEFEEPPRHEKAICEEWVDLAEHGVGSFAKRVYFICKAFPDVEPRDVGQALINWSIDVNEGGVTDIVKTAITSEPLAFDLSREDLFRRFDIFDESVEDVDSVEGFAAPTSTPIISSCGYCGAPLGPNGEDIIDVPDDYDPNAYEHSVCSSCGNEEFHTGAQRVTRDMAMDAGDLDLEGQPY